MRVLGAKVRVWGVKVRVWDVKVKVWGVKVRVWGVKGTVWGGEIDMRVSQAGVSDFTQEYGSESEVQSCQRLLLGC